MKTTIRFDKLGAPGWDDETGIYMDGAEVGTLERCLMIDKYCDQTISGYAVSFFDEHVVARTVEVIDIDGCKYFSVDAHGTARAALTAAKRWARETLRSV